MASAAIQAAFHARDVGPARGLLEEFEALRRDPFPWLLDGTEGHGPQARFSFAGADPWAVLHAWGDRVRLHVRRAVHPDWPVGRHRLGGDVFEALRQVVPGDAESDSAASDAIPFVGGAVGYFGYELAERIEPVAFGAREGAPFADATFLLVDALLAYDHRAGRLWHCGVGFGADAREARRSAEARARAVERDASPGLSSDLHGVGPGRFAEQARFRHDAASYGALVERVKAEIARGELYQACLTHRIDADFVGDPLHVYAELRRRNLAPFGAYLELPEGAILSSSPERFLRVDGEGRVEARPIKGTSARSESTVASGRARRALMDSEKDRAENVMIVDLYRNDLGRVCETGSVRVPELFAIEPHGQLHQMVSTVTGRLAAGRDRLDLVRAAFPPGSMTGAPKIAAMRLLAELETLRRGVYSGALGYLDVRGGMDLSVVIRTILAFDGHAHIHVGGGIVADSQPQAEWPETLDKANALLQALGIGSSPSRRVSRRRRGGGPAPKRSSAP